MKTNSNGVNNMNEKYQFLTHAPVHRVIGAMAIPTIISMLLTSVYNLVDTFFVGQIDTQSTAAVGIVFSVIIGLGQGFQPMCGFCYGAKLYDRVKEGFWFSTKIGTVFLLFWSVVLIIFSEEAVALFRKDPDVIAIGIKALRYQMIVFPACSFMMMANVTVKQKCARTIRTHFCFYKITTNSRTAVILPSSASFEDRALSFHLEYGGTYARSFNHISLFS